MIQINGTGFSTNPLNNSVTVAGNPCNVTSASSTSIFCILGPKNDSISTLLLTNDTNQTQGYFSGMGLQYLRYSTYQSSYQPFVDLVRNGSLIPEEISVATEVKSFHNVEAYKGEVWKGYFLAPTSGNYTFRGWASYAFAFYISSTYGSARPSQTPLIYSNASQYQWNNTFIDNIPTVSGTVELEANRSYYIEAYHITYYDGNGKFRIMVEVPNNNTKLPRQTYQIDRIDIGTDHQSEVMVYTMANGTGGNISLKIVRTDTNGKVIYKQNITVAYGCSSYMFDNALSYFSSFSYKRTVTRYAYDANNQSSTNPSLIKRYEYHVSFYLMRPQNYQDERFIVTSQGYDGTFEQQQLVVHSPLINGTFSLTVGGVSLNNGSIPYNVNPYYLQYYFRTIVGFQDVLVQYRT
jgi:hypothetical protein